MQQSTRISVWLTDPVVPCWSFSEGNRQRLQQLLPKANIKMCVDEGMFIRALPQTDIALVWQFRQQWFHFAPELCWIATPAAGRDYFQINPPASVRMSYGAFHGELIAETVLGMMLSMTRGVLPAAGLQESVSWPRGRLARMMRPLRGSHVAILGFGNIGTWIARLAKPLGVRITGIKRSLVSSPSFFEATDRIAAVEELDEILPTVDHLVLSLPGDAGTDCIIGARQLELLPEHAVIYNVGRGNAIDEEALAKVLGSGRIGGACLDVYQDEPLATDSPLRYCPNTFLMPHVSAIASNYLDLFIDEFAARYRQGN